MRQIPGDALTLMNGTQPIEPINIFEIQWVDDGPRVSYADRNIEPGVLGRVVEASAIDNTVNILDSGESAEMKVVLDDVDGTLKAIIDTVDIHKRPVWVYQWFDGLDLADKFLIFKGYINSPVEWNEGDRTLSFSIISKIEDREIGFSIEEGDFPDPDPELIGKSWPLCFGTVTNSPALRVKSARQGTLATGVGIKDFQLVKKGGWACPQNFVGFLCHGTGPIICDAVYEFDPGCLQASCLARASVELKLQEQSNLEYSHITIFGGDKFPQGVTLTLDINGGKFTGKFAGEVFTISSRRHPKMASDGSLIDDEAVESVKTTCGTPISPYATITVDGTDGIFGVDQTLGARASRASQEAQAAIKEAGFFWAGAGAKVTLDTEQEIIYVVNLLPSAIHRVAAYRDLEVGRELVTVPETLYTVRQVDYTGYMVTEIVFATQLSRMSEGWGDDIYVTHTSSVGPNTVDILTWLIETYTEFSIDATTFDAVQLAIDNYPMHFMMPGRKNILQALQELAFQSRCAVLLRDGTFYIKYLPDEPAADTTMTVGDIQDKSLVLMHTNSDDIVTKYIAQWREDLAKDDANKLILRHNVKQYGTKEETYDFYAFNILDLVRKSATFWLIRKANSWRRIKFQTPLHKLAVEVFDTVEITVNHVSPDPIKVLVEKAEYDSATMMIDFECWTPMKSGTTTPYVFAWPAQIDESLIFPTLEERAGGAAGSGSGPSFTTVAPPGHALNVQSTSNLYQGFSLSCNGQSTDILTAKDSGTPGACRPDHGQKKPSDQGDEKPNPKTPSGREGGVGQTTNPLSNSDLTKGLDEVRELANQAQSTAQAALKSSTTNKPNGEDCNCDDEEGGDRLPCPNDPIYGTYDPSVPSSIQLCYQH